MSEKINPIRETDEDARRQARLLLRGSPFGSIAALDPETGYPNCSRVLLGTAPDGMPVILISRLSAHTKALLSDARASLLVGEPGKGDPLASPRLTIQCDALPVARQSEDDRTIRARFLRRHKKAALYADFADFLFMRLRPLRASLNGGFGKAYALTENDLAIDSDATTMMADYQDKLLEIANRDWKNRDHEDSRLGNYVVCSLDPEGFDLRRGSQFLRLAFQKTMKTEGVKNILKSGFFADYT
ncbi:HugZ family protein [Rhizobium sp. L1K21]|uniref:HugZ family pyridoxamine 5'-phosphate oxidase n=1 Tax=Rhizobium sp. L1K21 TaxID=2954933 RepID=UPI0020935DF6|nr:pyridoxamine 5'-phosphate oxidase family protein [Rhizobium sp. L1K21]MCO6185379.1 pyridoxamine 5'-phosphate oxidase family protein [Rhizobium sp. L1K21]